MLTILHDFFIILPKCIKNTDMDNKSQPYPFVWEIENQSFILLILLLVPEEIVL